MKKLERCVAYIQPKTPWLGKLDLSIRIVCVVSFAFDCLIYTHRGTLCEPLQIFFFFYCNLWIAKKSEPLGFKSVGDRWVNRRLLYPQMERLNFTLAPLLHTLKDSASSVMKLGNPRASYMDPRLSLKQNCLWRRAIAEHRVLGLKSLGPLWNRALCFLSFHAFCLLHVILWAVEK